nr:hypothetical protein GCM10020093_080170 [Planobispora longispora]
MLRRTGSHPWGIVAALAVTSTVGYGVLFYSFAVFLGPMARDLRAGSAQITAALALAIVVNAAAAPLVGRLLDRYGGRWLMTAGSVVATLTVLAWSRVESLPALYAVFACMGVAMALTLYEPAFAVVVSWFDGRSRATALLAVTLVAGFATTIFSPLSGLLDAWYGWRQALVVLAVVLGVVTVPLHLIVVRRGPDNAHPPKAGVVGDALRDPSFWLLTGAFVAQSGGVYTLAMHLVSYLTSLGHPGPFASLVTGLVGVLSVTGRLATTGLQRRWRPRRSRPSCSPCRPRARPCSPSSAVRRPARSPASCSSASGTAWARSPARCCSPSTSAPPATARSRAPPPCRSR